MKPVIEETLRELLDFAQRHGLEEVMWREEGVKIAFRRSVAAPVSPSTEEPASPSEPQAPVEEVVRSPMVGIFRRSVSKDRPPLVLEGNHIKPGDRLAVVECMKIPTDVVSFCEGEIKEIMIEDGQPVEFGQPLFSVVPFASPAQNGKH